MADRLTPAQVVPRLRLHTDDPVLRALARSYWSRTDGTFTHRVRALEDVYGIRNPVLSRTLTRAATLEWTCPGCGVEQSSTTRTEWDEQLREHCLAGGCDALPPAANPWAVPAHARRPLAQPADPGDRDAWDELATVWRDTGFGPVPGNWERQVLRWRELGASRDKVRALIAQVATEVFVEETCSGDDCWDRLCALGWELVRTVRHLPSPHAPRPQW